MDGTAGALRDQAVDYIQRWIGTPYKYGGDDFSGFDCSGLVLEALQSVGLVSIFKDLTAHEIYLKFKNKKPKHEMPYPGCLAFWFKGSGKAYHVAMLISRSQVCEAAGGGEETETEEDAIKHNAYVRVRRLNYRGQNFKIVDPFRDWDPGAPMK